MAATPLIHLPSIYGDAIENMAVDSTLLQTNPEGHALFRHYGWIEPTLTFGYTQRFHEVSALEPKDICHFRRPTAGGIVDHRNDWTYSLILHDSLPSAQWPLTDIYRCIHQSLQQALEKLQVPSRLAPCPRQCQVSHDLPEDSPHCFTKPVANDVLSLNDPTKIAGAAIKRSRSGILLQGSIDRSTLPLNFSFHKFAELFVQAIAQEFNLTTAELPDLRPLFPQSLIKDTRKHYASSQWLQKR